MKKVLSSLMLCLSLFLVLSVPAFAESTAVGNTTTRGTTMTGNTVTPNTYANRTDGFFGTTTGTGVNGTTGMYGPYGTNAYGTNAYGTHGYGTGAYGAYDGTLMNRGTTNVTTRANNTVRRMDTAPRRGFNWGWLGLLGLFGLAGMRSRNREDAR